MSENVGLNIGATCKSCLCAQYFILR